MIHSLFIFHYSSGDIASQFSDIGVGLRSTCDYRIHHYRPELDHSTIKPSLGGLWVDV